MPVRHRRCAALACLLFLPAPPMARAQEVVATSFDQLRMIARLGDTVTLTDASGQEVKGKLGDLSSSTLTLVGINRTFTESDIRRVKRVDHARLATGARWGFGMGIGTGLMLAAAYGGAECYRNCAPLIVIGTLAYGGLGAGIGVGISALIPTRQLIYEQPLGPAAHPTVSPLVTRERRGIAVTIGF